MRKENCKAQPVRLRLGDKINLALSTARHVDGIWVGCWRGNPGDLIRVEEALSLIKQHSPLDYARITRELERVWVDILSYGRGQYRHALRACMLDERYVANPTTTAEEIASTIVHEATHARLVRYGFEYKEELRSRIEMVCVRRQLAFAVRLPNSTERHRLAFSLEWHRSNPDQFSDTRFLEYRTKGIAEALRYLGVPDWLIQAVLASRPLVHRTRRYSPLLAWAISIPAVMGFGLRYAFGAILDSLTSRRSEG